MLKQWEKTAIQNSLKNRTEISCNDMSRICDAIDETLHKMWYNRSISRLDESKARKKSLKVCTHNYDIIWLVALHIWDTWKKFRKHKSIKGIWMQFVALDFFCVFQNCNKQADFTCFFYLISVHDSNIYSWKSIQPFYKKKPLTFCYVWAKA